MSTRITAEQRFWAKVDKRGADECWLWTGGTTGANGYGKFQFSPAVAVVAHRYAYELLVGPIPVGLVIDHLCMVKLCQNPRHMEPVTNRDNVLRAIRATRTHCKRGHPVVNGGRCAVCTAATKRRWEERNRGNAEYRERRREQERERYRRNMLDPEWRARKQAKERAGQRRRKEIG